MPGWISACRAGPIGMIEDPRVATTTARALPTVPISKTRASTMAMSCILDAPKPRKIP